MAADITRVKTERHAVKEWAWTALATTGKTINFEGVDENCAILITGTANDTVTFVKGDHIQGVADLALSITADKLYAIAIPSMEFKNVGGTNKGMVVVKGASTSKVAVVEIDQL